MAGWAKNDELAADLHDTLEGQALRGKRSMPAPDAAVRPQEPFSAAARLGPVDCPDCNTAGSLPRYGVCEVCGLTWDDLVTAAAFYDDLVAGALADAALPSPREATYPKGTRGRP